MKEELRHDIVQRWQQGQSQRHIASELGVSRRTVERVLAVVSQERAQGNVAPELRPAPPRACAIDAYETRLRELLQRHPQLSARRCWQELRAQGFGGSYKQVWSLVRVLRPRPPKTPVVRFETGPAAQAQSDYSVHDLDFTEEGRRRVYLFSYILGFSRRAYLRWVESMDFETTVREHIRAFTYLGGVAACCLYDNQKVVVLRWQDGEPLYNPRFLAFATHYGFQPMACKPRTPRTKGKVERYFRYVQESLLAGREFRSLAHLNEVTAWWLNEVADVRLPRSTGKTPRQRHAEELPQLLPLPACDFQADPVVYRTVDAEGFVAWRGNRYAVPYCHIGRLLPVRLSETALIMYGPDLHEIARHPLLARSCTGQQSVLPGQHPQVDHKLQQAQLQERFAALDPAALRFYEGVLKHQRYSRSQAHRVLALLAIYAAKDVVAALERAVRYGAFAADAVERILARSAQPRTALEKWAERQQEHLRELLGDQPLSPRPAADYRIFFTEDLPHVETTPPTPPADADRSDAAAPSDDADAGPPPSAADPPEQPEDRPGGPDA
jgi:transposase